MPPTTDQIGLTADGLMRSKSTSMNAGSRCCSLVEFKTVDNQWTNGVDLEITMGLRGP